MPITSFSLILSSGMTSVTGCRASKLAIAALTDGTSAIGLPTLLIAISIPRFGDWVYGTYNVGRGARSSALAWIPPTTPTIVVHISGSRFAPILIWAPIGNGWPGHHLRATSSLITADGVD